MINNKRNILTAILILISINILLYINNKQKTSLRYFIWNIENVPIGRLITISFASGVLISSLLNKTISTKYINYYDDNKIDKDLDNSNSELNDNNDFEMPPQRDIRETQPTISVNYRVIKNNVKDNLREEEDYSNHL